jgi:hypothetical protein
LGEAIVSEKQSVKDLLEEHVGALFRSIEEEFERSREVRVALTDEEAQIMDDLLNRTVTAAKVRGFLEEKLKECGVDVEAIKAELHELTVASPSGTPASCFCDRGCEPGLGWRQQASSYSGPTGQIALAAGANIPLQLQP